MSIFEFSEYKSYLKQLVNSQKRGFSARMSFALKIAPSQLNRIIHGELNFTDEHMALFAIYLKLTDAESQYLFNLVHMARSENEDAVAFFKMQNERLTQTSRPALSPSSEASKFLVVS